MRRLRRSGGRFFFSPRPPAATGRCGRTWAPGLTSRARRCPGRCQAGRKRGSGGLGGEGGEVGRWGRVGRWGGGEVGAALSCWGAGSLLGLQGKPKGKSQPIFLFGGYPKRRTKARRGGVGGGALTPYNSFKPPKTVHFSGQDTAPSTLRGFDASGLRHPDPRPQPRSSETRHGGG